MGLGAAPQEVAPDQLHLRLAPQLTAPQVKETPALPAMKHMFLVLPGTGLCACAAPGSPLRAGLHRPCIQDGRFSTQGDSGCMAAL